MHAAFAVASREWSWPRAALLLLAVFVARTCEHTDVGTHTSYRIMSLQLSPDGRAQLHQTSRQFSEVRAAFDQIAASRSDLTALAEQEWGFSCMLRCNILRSRAMWGAGC